MTGDIVEDVQKDENIPEHFAPLLAGESAEVPKNPAFEPPEPITLSEIQDAKPKEAGIFSKPTKKK